MYEFVEKVNEYVKKNHGRRVKFDTHHPHIYDAEKNKYKRDTSNTSYIVYTETREGSCKYFGHKVYDCQDFEKLVFEAVNKVLVENRAGGFELWEHRR